MATTLLQFAQARQAARLTALQNAQVAQAAVLAADKAAEGLRVTAAAAAQAASAAVDAVHKQLALAETPAQVAALSLQLKARSVVARAALDTLAAKDLLRVQAAAQVATALKATDGARQSHDASVAALVLASAADQRRHDLIDTALATPPLQDVPTEATAALASADFAAAKARIENALPQPLRDRARARTRQAAAASRASLTRLAGAQAAFDSEAEASGLGADTQPRLQRAFDAADADLARYAASAVARGASAVAGLKRLAALTNDPLTADQRTSLNDLQGTARPDAAAAQKARDDAALVLADAAARLHAERIEALATDPGGDIATMEADAATFPDLAQARADFDAAKGDHDTKAVAFNAGMAQRLAEWQAEVPDALWSEAAVFYAAEDTLTDLKTAPAAMLTALQNAEAALLSALASASQRQARVEFVAASLAAEQALQSAVGQRAGERSAAALRGDLVIDALLLP